MPPLGRLRQKIVKKRGVRAARLFFLIQPIKQPRTLGLSSSRDTLGSRLPIKSLICGVVVAVAVVIS